MRRHIGAVGATLTAASLILVGAGSVRAATPQSSQANAALRYLYSQVGPDGSVAAAFGPGATEDTVISVADSGYDPATLKNPSTGASTYDYLSSHAAAINTAGGAAKYVIAWLAAGKPAAIDGSALLTRLNTPASAGGYLQPNGAFHNTSASIETANAYSQSLAVLADAGAGHSLPANAAAWLACAQRADGGFGYAIDDSASSPPASCGDSASDTNDSAIILQALGAAGVTSANSAAEAYLHSVQHSDGGFGFNAGSGSDPDSDGTVIQALIAIGQDPSAASWTQSGGGNALTNMESFADPHGSGGYTSAGSTTPDAFTTSTIPQALALKPYAAATTVVAGSSPAAPATSPSPTGVVKGVTVPATGSAGDLGGGSVASLLLLALGSMALAVTALQGPRRSRP